MVSDERTTVKQDVDKVHKIAYQAIDLIGEDAGPLRWVSGQQDNGEWIGYGFAVGEGFAFVSFDDLARDVDDLARDCAEQILGYPLGSREDLERRLEYARLKHLEFRSAVEAAKMRMWRWYDEMERITRELYPIALPADDESEGGSD